MIHDRQWWFAMQWELRKFFSSYILGLRLTDQLWGYFGLSSGREKWPNTSHGKIAVRCQEKADPIDWIWLALPLNRLLLSRNPSIREQVMLWRSIVSCKWSSNGISVYSSKFRRTWVSGLQGNTRIASTVTTAMPIPNDCILISHRKPIQDNHGRSPQ